MEITADTSFVNNQETLVSTAKLHMFPYPLSNYKLISDAIQLCYSQSADMYPADFRTNINQLRSISASLANLGRTALEQVVLAGRWKFANYFTFFSTSNH